MLENLFFNPYAVLQLLVGFFMITQGVFILMQNPRSSLHRSFFWWEFAVFVWMMGMGTSYLFHNAEIARLLCLFGFLGVMYIPITTYAFSVYFVDDKRQRLFILLGFLTTLTISLFLFSPLINNGIYSYSWGYYTKLGDLGYSAAALFVVFVPLFVRNYYIKYKKSPVQYKKGNRLNIIFGGLAFLAATDFLPGFGIAFPFPPLGYIFVGIFATLMGYSIVRHQLSDIKMQIGKSVGYIIMTSILFLLCGGILMIFNLNNLPLRQIFFQTVLFLIILYFLSYFKKWSQKVVDEIFFKEKINFEKLIRKFISNIGDLRDQKVLTDFLFAFVTEQLRIDGCSLYIYKEGEKRWQIYRSKQENSKEQPYFEAGFSYKSGNKYLKKLKAIKRSEILSNGPLFELEKETQRVLENEQAEVAFPILHREELLGLFVLNKKTSNEDFNRVDIELISEFLVPLGIAWINSEQYAELERSNELRNNFVTILSHQLRTPLTEIKWAIQTLKDDSKNAISPTQKEAIYSRLLSSVSSVVTLIGQLLSISETDKKNIKNNVSFSVNVEKMFEQLLEENNQAIKHNKLNLEKKVFDGEVVVRCSEEAFKLIMSIILNNAVRYTKEKGTILMSAKIEENKKLQISVQDSGIGIPSGVQSRIFEKYFRADNAKILQPDGTGIGLHYAKSLIRQYGGDLWFRSEENKGSTFFLSLEIIKN